MPECTTRHTKKIGKKTIVIPHYYIAGNCISDPLNQGGFETFLRASYPYNHGEEYELSKTEREHIVPNNVGCGYNPNYNLRRN